MMNLNGSTDRPTDQPMLTQHHLCYYWCCCCCCLFNEPKIYKKRDVTKSVCGRTSLELKFITIFLRKLSSALVKCVVSYSIWLSDLFIECRQLERSNFHCRVRRDNTSKAKHRIHIHHLLELCVESMRIWAKWFKTGKYRKILQKKCFFSSSSFPFKPVACYNFIALVGFSDSVHWNKIPWKWNEIAHLKIFFCAFSICESINKWPKWQKIDYYVVFWTSFSWITKRFLLDEHNEIERKSFLGKIY